MHQGIWVLRSRLRAFRIVITIVIKCGEHETERFLDDDRWAAGLRSVELVVLTLMSCPFFCLHALWESLGLSVPEFLPTRVSRAQAFDSTRRESERTADIFHWKEREDISPPPPPPPPPRHVALLARI